MNIGKILKKYWKLSLLWIIFFAFIISSFWSPLDKKITASVILLYGLITQIFGIAFSFLVSVVGTIPWLGPVLVGILMWPLTAVVNIMAVSLGVIRIKQGNIKKVIGARIAALLLAVGILLGYLIGKII
ncbi:MAG: hypothetical protein ACMUIP_00220 [bacterium]